MLIYLEEERHKIVKSYLFSMLLTHYISQDMAEYGILNWKTCIWEWAPFNSSVVLGLSKSQVFQSHFRKLLCGNNKKVYLIVSFIPTTHISPSYEILVLMEIRKGESYKKKSIHHNMILTMVDQMVSYRWNQEV